MALPYSSMTGMPLSVPPGRLLLGSPGAGRARARAVGFVLLCRVFQESLFGPSRSRAAHADRSRFTSSNTAGAETEQAIGDRHGPRPTAPARARRGNTP